MKCTITEYGKKTEDRKSPNEMLINLIACNMQKTDQRNDHSMSDQESVQGNILPPTAAKRKDQGKTITT